MLGVVTPQGLLSVHLFVLLFTQLNLNASAGPTGPGFCDPTNFSKYPCKNGLCCSKHFCCGEGSPYCGQGNCSFQCWKGISAVPTVEASGNCGTSSTPSHRLSPGFIAAICIGGIILVAVLVAAARCGKLMKIVAYNRVPRLTEPPYGMRKLNESVYELHRPEGIVKLEVIFFHGLQLSNYGEAYWRTWLSRDDPTIIWPKEWLGPALKDTRITSVSYDSSAQQTRTRGNMKINPIIENLTHDLVLNSNFVIGERSTIVLVGHSLGGLIIKRLLLNINERAGLIGEEDPNYARMMAFLRNCRGVFYYSTPHTGTKVANYADFAKKFPFTNVNMPIIKFLKALNDQTAQTNNDFSNFRRTQKLRARSRALGELRNTRVKIFSRSLRVVDEASARGDIDVNDFYTADADHFEVCKAENRTTSPVFTFLRDFCIELVPEVRVASYSESEQLLL